MGHNVETNSTITRHSQPTMLTFLYFSLISLSLFFSYRTTDPDLFARVAVGKLFLESGFTEIDPFSFAPKKSTWVDHEWLSGVIFYLIQLHTSWNALFAFKVLVLLPLAACVITPARNKEVASLFLIPTLHVFMSTVRAQTLTYLGVAMAYFALRLWQQNKRTALYCLTCLLPLFINSHGGFVFIYLLCGSFFIAQVFQRQVDRGLILASLLTAAALLIMPYSPATYYPRLFEALMLERRNVPEWQPAELFSIPWWYLVGLTITLGFTIKRVTKNDCFLVIALCLALYGAFSSYRFIGFASLLAACLFSQIVPPKPFFTRLLRGSAYTLIILAILRSSPGPLVDERSYPGALLQRAVTDGYKGKLLIDFMQGSCAMWYGYPHFTVSMDGRYEELYEEETALDNLVALDVTNPRHNQVINTLQPDYALVRREAPFAGYYVSRGGTVVLEDDTWQLVKLPFHQFMSPALP